MDHSVGKFIRETREALSWPAERLAAAARLDVEILLALERGEGVDVSTATVDRIARALGVTPAEWLRAQSDAATPPAAVYFRQLGVPDFDSRDIAIVTRAIEVAASFDRLSAELGRR